MNSPILEAIYQSTGIDPAYLLFILTFLVIVLIVITVITLCKLRKLYQRYDRFMRGKDAESLEDTLLSCISKTEEVDKMNQMLREDIIGLRKNQRITYQKMGMLKYNAFREMSGDERLCRRRKLFEGNRSVVVGTCRQDAEREHRRGENR